MTNPNKALPQCASHGEPQGAEKILDHKWLDPECIEKGCQSLVWKGLYESAVKGRSEFRQAYRDVRATPPGADVREATIKLQARPAEGGDWIDIFPSQLQWMAKEGHDVRALSEDTRPQTDVRETVLESALKEILSISSGAIYRIAERALSEGEKP
jgi:hypothetical protein